MVQSEKLTCSHPPLVLRSSSAGFLQPSITDGPGRFTLVTTSCTSPRSAWGAWIMSIAALARHLVSQGQGLIAVLIARGTIELGWACCLCSATVHTSVQVRPPKESRGCIKTGSHVRGWRGARVACQPRAVMPAGTSIWVQGITHL